MDTVNPSQITLLMIAVSSLAASVVFLFFWFRAQYEACRKSESECNSKYIQLVERVARIEGVREYVNKNEPQR